MTNEWLEFQAYIKKPTYSAASKHDLSYLGRFTFKTITDFEGFGRILTVIARGYLFHNQDGSLRGGNPYELVEYAINALCAWCSVPDKNEDEPFTNFDALSSDFPELVNAKGTRKSRVPHGEITWAPPGNHVGPTGKSRGPHPVCFQVFVVVNNAAVNTGVHVSFKLVSCIIYFLFHFIF